MNAELYHLREAKEELDFQLLKARSDLVIVAGGDGTLNAAYNCLDRHVEAGLGDRVAFHFDPAALPSIELSFTRPVY